jgi:hypothetical protein
MKRTKRNPDEDARSDELRRMAVEQIERRGARVPETDAEREAFERFVARRIAPVQAELDRRLASS